MFGLSFTHLILLAVIIIIFVGPEQLPEVARTIARLLNEWKRASSEIQGSLARTLKEEVDSEPVTPAKAPQLATTAPPPSSPTPPAQPAASHSPSDLEQESQAKKES